MYKLDCLDRYVDTILKGQIHHMSYCQMNPIVHPKSTWENRGYIVKYINQQAVMNHKGRGVGCLLTFTPELINKIGYFRVLPQKFGSEHVNFSKRVISMNMAKFHFDIDKSVNYVEHIGFWPLAENLYGKCHSISKTNQKKCSEENRKYVNIDLHLSF